MTTPVGNRTNHPGHDREKILTAFEDYIEATTIPIICEFASSQRISKSTMYAWPEAKELLERCVSKKEGALEREALQGRVNVVMAIFSLKQLGWKDRTELSGDGQHPIMLLPVQAKL